MIKAVIFDLDNTLVDFMSMKQQAITAQWKDLLMVVPGVFRGPWADGE